LTGTEDESSGLGGEAEGVLREYAVFNQNLLLHLPKHLSWEEVSYLALQRRSIFTFLRLTPFTLCRQHVLHAPA
jgi:NADPH:quinone reductase-like Zn-dependent oxidoreductase